MDPYLEDPNIWPGFHHSLADEIMAQLNLSIGPKYYADLEIHTRTEAINVIAPPRSIYPDVGVLATRTAGAVAVAEVVIPQAPVERVVMGRTKLLTVQVYVTETATLVTAIEILSPFNKRAGRGLDEYRAKRERLLESPVHLVELDLLRAGQRPGPETLDPPLETDYLLLVNRSREAGQRISDIWPVALYEPLPTVPVPLLPPDPDAPLDLNGVLAAVYHRAAYGRRLNYQQPVPLPALRPEVAAWLRSRRDEGLLPQEV
jgi:hypothetical protein